MTLTGVDPNDPTPSTRRELLFAQGASAGGGTARDVVLFGNKTSAGSETVDTLGVPIADDSDAQARFGVRSELYRMYRSYIEVDPAATIYGIAVTESGGTAATVDLTVATPPTAAASLEISCMGYKGYVNVASGDSIATIADAIEPAINAMDNSQLMVTAVSDTIDTVTVTATHKGPRGGYILNSLRTRCVTSPGSTTVSKGSVTAGTTEDDGSTAIAQAAASDIYYWVVPWTANTAGTAPGSAKPTTTDGQLGEAMLAIKTNAAPSVGKESVLIYGLGETASDASDVADETSMNSVRGFGFHAEDNDWPPLMVAAHMAGVMRSQQVAHPSANIAGYKSTDSTIFNIQDPFDKTDRPTPIEIKTMLNAGVSPIAFTAKGAPYLVRQITNRSHDGANNPDYRAREGHITSAIDFFWSVVAERWETQKQPFASDNLKDGQLPTARTTTPAMVDGMIKAILEDFTSSKPLGKYDGPILAPDKLDEMKKSVKTSKIPAGVAVNAEPVAVEHLLKFEGKFAEVGGAY